MDALDGAGLEYVLALQEATAVAAADGYAQMSGALGVVNLHVAPGVANGLGILHNAWRARTPLLVTAGQQDTRFLVDEPILAGDLVRMAAPFTKWAHEVRRAEDALPALRRAVTTALAPPTGPVFLSLPMDVVAEPLDGDDDLAPARAEPAAPAPDAVARAAAILLGARAPVVIAGDGVGRGGAVEALVRLAEALGAAVHAEPVYRRTNFPADHPLWRGGLYPAPAAVRKALDGADALLIVGANVFTWFLHAPGAPFPRGLRVIQLDDDPRQIGRSYPVDLGLVGDPRLGVEALERAVLAAATAAQRTAAAERAAALGRARAEHARRLATAAAAEATRTPISVVHAVATLGALLPEDAVVVDESASSLPHVLRHVRFRRPGSYFGSKTGTLGWAMGAALGVQLAAPERTVVVTIGDGSVMYAPQALWTAARYRLPIAFVVLNNASYAILKAGMASLGLPAAKKGFFPGMDLVDPEIDYLGLARALGVRAERVTEPAALRDALAGALARRGPALVDVAIDRGWGGGA
jgi:benzoylformate decarboxylase